MRNSPAHVATASDPIDHLTNPRRDRGITEHDHGGQFADPFPYGLGDLPIEPPDTFNGSYPTIRPNPMRPAPIGAPNVIQAGVRLPFPQQLPPGPWHLPGQQLAPGRIPQTPEWWRTLGAMLQLLPRMATGSFGGSGEDEDPDCKKDWMRAREFCSKELAKPSPNRGLTGGHTNVEDCARGHVDERCRGNPLNWGDQPRRR